MWCYQFKKARLSYEVWMVDGLGALIGLGEVFTMGTRLIVPK